MANKKRGLEMMPRVVTSLELLAGALPKCGHDDCERAATYFEPEWQERGEPDSLGWCDEHVAPRRNEAMEFCYAEVLRKLLPRLTGTAHAASGKGS